MPKIFFARLGGKTNLAKEIVSRFKNDTIDTYVEPFIGAGAVFLEHSLPVSKEVINDLDKDIYDIWNDLKVIDIDSLEEFHLDSKETFNQYLNSSPDEPYERFKRNMIISRFSHRGNRKGFAYSSLNRSLFKDCFKKKTKDIQCRIKDTIIHNKDYKEIIKQYDSPSTFFYLDPPYSTAIREKDYNHSIDINELIDILKNMKGKFLLSYDYSEANLELFKDFKVDVVNTKYASASKGMIVNKKELIIVNY